MRRKRIAKCIGRRNMQSRMRNKTIQRRMEVGSESQRKQRGWSKHKADRIAKRIAMQSGMQYTA
jgi:hypothetical protein